MDPNDHNLRGLALNASQLLLCLAGNYLNDDFNWSKAECCWDEPLNPKP